MKFRTRIPFTLFACLILAASMPANSATPAIYIQHVGDSDKPILPAVVSVDKPPADEQITMLGADDAEFASFFQVSADDFKKLTGIIVPVLDREEKAAGYRFGTFKLIRVSADATTERVLERAEFLKTLETLITFSAGKYPSLTLWLETVGRRLGR